MDKKRNLIIGLTCFLFNTPSYSISQDCSTDFTQIHKIQGVDFVSPLKDEQVRTQGIVTSVWNKDHQMKGFFLQASPDSWDNNPSSSEAIYVQAKSHTEGLKRGDLVEVYGTVTETYEVTTISSVTSLKLCDENLESSIIAQRIFFPTDNSSLEALEGMEVDLSDLEITGQYYLGRYGQLSLSPERLTIPTQEMIPSSAAHYREQNHKHWRIVVDDGSNQQNPLNINYLPNLSSENAPRLGQKVISLKGNLHFAFGEYRIEASSPLQLKNKARMVLPNKTPAQTRVVSFNVLNAFNGDGFGGQFPTARGAKTHQEWIRQRDKLVSALLELDADLYGLSELENDGFSPQSAIAEITREYNKKVINPTQKLSYIDPKSNRWGGDAITVGFLYRPSSIQAVGKAYTTQAAPFGRGRGPMLQTFKRKDSEVLFTAVVAHYKSKGGCPEDGSLDDNRKDGQSCWSFKREIASKVILNWAPKIAKKYNSRKVMVMGDLNSYAQEDAISIFKDFGWQNLGASYRRLEDPFHSFVFIGQKGTLDYVIGNENISKNVDQAYHWPINSDEPRILDYRLEHRSSEQAKRWYAPNPYRSSDHDPVIVDFSF